MLLGAEPLIGAMEAAPVTDPVDNDPLPFISITGTATSPQTAIVIARRGAEVFSQYVARRQANAGTAAAQRVQLEVVNAAQGAELELPRKKTTPIFVFLAVMIAVLGLVFMLENIRPRPTSSAAVVLPTLGNAASVDETAADTTPQAAERRASSAQRRASSG